MSARSTVSLSRQVLTWIRNLRKARGLSLNEFAEVVTKAGYPISKHCISNWESRPQAALTIDFVAAAAEALGVSVDYLLARECELCKNNPPCGFSCNQCGATS